MNILASTIIIMGALLLLPSKASAHCDTMNGPVVTAGQKALDTGNINHALVWIKKENDDQLKAAFETALKNRKNEGQKADIKFFEALVRIHREGEGAAYTGLKAAGDLDPSIAAADEAVFSGQLQPVLEIVPEEYHTHVSELFNHMQELTGYDVDNVAAGREFVESYVKFVHVVEAAAQGKDLGSHHDLPKDNHEAEKKSDQPVVEASLVSTPVILVGLVGLGIGFLVKKFFI